MHWNFSCLILYQFCRSCFFCRSFCRSCFFCRSFVDPVSFVDHFVDPVSFVDPSSVNIELFEKDLARFEEQTKMLHERSEFQSSEIKQLRLENEQILAEKKAICDKSNQLNRQLLESEARREQLQFRDEEGSDKVRRYEAVIENHETALTESENIIEQLNANIKRLTDEVNELREEKVECFSISFSSF